jgi:hypothetical protein
VGFEPTSTNTLELESSPLDRSGTNAAIVYVVKLKQYYHITLSYFALNMQERELQWQISRIIQAAALTRDYYEYLVLVKDLKALVQNLVTK